MENIEKEIKENKFVIFLQGKFDTNTEKIAGAEALIRKKEKHKFILPNEFIVQYEKTGEIIKLDMYVLEEVCKLQSKWKENHYPILPISINESRQHLKNPNHIKELTDIIQKYHVNPKYIELELTETTVIEDINLAKQAEQRVHELGFQTSMDDFGTGYSAFNVLKDIEIDILKIDRLFFENLEENSRARIIVQSIVEMCKKLNIKTVAEGIENEAQVKFLKEIGCDLIQGYYFSKPLPIEEFEEKYIIKNFTNLYGIII